MITLNNINFSYGARKIFDNAGASIDETANALTGRNGTGKTTLFNIITGNITPQSGEIIITKGHTVGYLQQEMHISDSSQQPVEFVLGNIEFYNRYNKMLKELESGRNDSAFLERFADTQERYNLREGYLLPEKTREVLTSLGFDDEIEKSISELSYGFRMRLFLAKLLLEKNDILLLDEPTNHLDLPSIKWLETYLKDYKGLLLIVSHDRSFLDNVCTQTIELNKAKLRKFKGNYSFFINEKEKELEHEQKEMENLLQKKETLERFIERFKAKNTKASAARSKAKVLDKVNDKLDEFDFSKSKTVKFMNKETALRSKTALQVHIESKIYDTYPVIEDTDISIAPDQRIFLIGANGRGKSTLLRIIAEADRDFEGEIKKHENLNVLYFDFDSISRMQSDTTVLDFIFAAAETEYQAKSLLGMMLFSEDDYSKRISVLSGGEKVRLYMTKLFTETFNFIILDEPTNYLDIETIEIFIEWLRRLRTGFIIVTHNEYLLEKVRDSEIWTIENRRVRMHFCNYSSYSGTGYAPEKQEPVEEAVQTSDFKQKKRDRQEKINARIEINKKIQQIEAHIEKLEHERTELYATMSSPDLFEKHKGNEIAAMKDRINEVEYEIAEMYREWDVLTESMPDLEEET